MHKVKEKKEKTILVLLTDTERNEFREACKYYKIKYSAFFRKTALVLINKYKNEHR